MMKFLIYYLKRYTLSLLVIAAVTYLSFFKPPTDGLPMFTGLDKLVHVLMYLGMSGMLWLEFSRAHRKKKRTMWHVWVGGGLFPILFSGGVELIQEYCTTYRGGDWLDFLANFCGVAMASVAGYVWLTRFSKN